MKSNKPLANLLITAASTLGISASCSDSPSENARQNCAKDSDCSAEQICNSQNTCIDPGQEMLSYQQKASLGRDRIDFSLTVEGVVHRTYVLVKTKSGEPILNVIVHYAANSQGEIILAVDPERRFQPEVVERTFSSMTSSLSSSQVHQALRLDHVDIPLDPIETGKKVYEIISTDERLFLGQLGPVNRYCMTLEQLLHSEIDIPAGLVMLAPEAAGIDAQKIKVAVTSKLKDIFSNWIIRKFGNLPAYEVWVPRTAVNACDEQDYGAVCNISTDALSQRVWNPQGMPYWEIKGACPTGPTTPIDTIPPTQSDSVRIVSLSPPLTCIQFDRQYAVGVTVDYTHGPIRAGSNAQVRLQLSSYTCAIQDTANATTSSGSVTLQASFIPRECYEREPLFYTLTAMLQDCNSDGCSTLAQEGRNVPKCPAN